MPLENLEGPDVFIDDLNNAWPLGSDTPSEGDDHLRGIKNVLRNWAGTIGDQPLQDALDALFAPLVHTHLWADITDKPTEFPPEAHTHVSADITDLDTTLAPYAPLAAPELTGAATLDGEAIATQPFVVTEVNKPGRAVTGDYTLVADDVGRSILQSTTGEDRVLNVPTNATVPYAIGTRINVINYGQDTITITPASGVNVYTKGASLLLGENLAAVTLEKVDTNTWIGIGDLS